MPPLNVLFFVYIIVNGSYFFRDKITQILPLLFIDKTDRTVCFIGKPNLLTMPEYGILLVGKV